MCPAPLGHQAYNQHGEGGRPTKYTEEFINGEAAALLEWLKKGKFIWFERFAIERGYNPNLLSSWADKNERFSEAYSMAKEHQRIVLIEGGLYKKFQFNMAQLLLGYHYGIVSKTETKLSGDAGNPLTFLLQQADGRSKTLVNPEEVEGVNE